MTQYNGYTPPGQGSNDPLNVFASMGMPGPNSQGFGPQGRRTAPDFGGMQNAGQQAGQRFDSSQTGYGGAQGSSMNLGGGFGNTGGLTNNAPISFGANPARARNDAVWNSLFSQSVFGDMQNQQAVADEQFSKLSGQTDAYGRAMQEGAESLRNQNRQQRESLGGMAAKAEQQGSAGYNEFKNFRDQQMARVSQDISKANALSEESTEGFKQAISQYSDRSAQQAGDLRIGLERQYQSAMKDINSGMNPDGTMMSPAEKAANRQNLQQSMGEQVSQGVNQIFTAFNDTKISMEGNLASLRQAQSQTAMAGGQLRGQTGLGFGAQTLDAQKVRAGYLELSANLTTTMEQMSAASELGAINLLTNGHKDMYEMISNNKRGVTSMYAALSGWLAGMTTPGLDRITPPNFGPNT